MCRASVNTPARRSARWPGLLLIALTATVCCAALILRTPVRSRYWAWQIAHGTDELRQAAYLTALCQSGSGGRWGISALLRDEHAGVRQFGVLALRHVDDSWTRDRLVQLLRDEDPDVRALAAVGLAVRAHDDVIPELEALYRAGGPAAAAACRVLARLGTPAAIRALGELVSVPAEVGCRAALVDALADIRAPACVPVLLELLDDVRPAGHVPPVAQQRAAEVVAALRLRGILVSAGVSAQPAPATIAERAAAALARVTGVCSEYDSAASDEVRRRAAAEWAAWYKARADAP